MRKNKKILIGLVVILLISLTLRELGLLKYTSIDNLQKLKEWIESYGILGPIIYVLGYIMACLFFLPGLPIALLSGVVFGPIKGAILGSIGSTLGATAAFLVGRYIARDYVEELVKKNKTLRNIDKSVDDQGWRILMITRLVPIFPFNLQNYAYGLTKIKLKTYILVSWLCMMPATIGFSFVGAGFTEGMKDIKIMLTYVGIGGILLVLMSYVPKLIKERP
ncbi:TVP38/TMEM64 family protein [Anaeromicrobium sediminis]|uniref:TVP38/TMEM64 family membrane protein n=1 Tax=Anaeromicrobium sediminis TaxID=1478221 RepID=A0A267MI18_9FIRM|nr:TVP38/TMEM64 family protein [Anaeromicrobium sediminis]PAB58578.1 hypothetical protein CCE28_14885 [Anaeromicrobium sediminis]